MNERTLEEMYRKAYTKYMLQRTVFDVLPNIENKRRLNISKSVYLQYKKLMEEKNLSTEITDFDILDVLEVV